MMAFIGYSSSGYSDLAGEIRTRKGKLLDILNSFPEVEQAISDSWKGEDAESYKAELSKVIEATKESVSSTYDAMASQFEKTYNDWVEKQRANGAQ